MGTWGIQLALVMVGGALGAALRFMAGGWLLRQFGGHWPWGTLAVNLVGSFLIGFLVIWLEGRGPTAVYWRALLMVGVLGGLTTYSSLMLESLLMGHQQRIAGAAGYLAVTLVCGLLLVWLGARGAQLLRAG